MTSRNTYRIGIDAGSTTLKFIVIDPESKIIYKKYTRHKANIQNVLIKELHILKEEFGNKGFRFCITGSAGMGIAERIGIPFVQEVVAAIELIQKQFASTKVLLDLGGEDAKMVFFEKNRQPDIRMNGSCAGGTGAFIDQMASLMNIPVEELGTAAEQYKKVYPIASRCGVFAKTDIQNLISRNIPTSDIAASTLHAVAIQNITSLARGYEIKGPVLCIGGPLTFIPALKTAFAEALNLSSDEFIIPENSEFFPAWGAALHINDNEEVHNLGELIDELQKTDYVRSESLQVLFKDKEEYENWKQNRKVQELKIKEIGDRDKCFLGIDSGSTTTKIVIINEDSEILFKYYSSNEGNSLQKVIEGLSLFYREAEAKNIQARITASAVTGYGEDLIRSALNLNYGIVETMAHLKGAQYINPNVTFILDIGGQDIKSIFTEKGVISNIELNEACSAGCGSFLQNFASTMNVDLSDFSREACLAKQPCDLGSRCTVFMNSKVKQSLRENAAVGDIAAGLAYSVVKNCLFKVLKINNLNNLGNHIVVQGGTFRNDAVYRALEILSEKSISSTDHPELMGAFGAALYAQSRSKEESCPTTVFNPQSLHSLLDSIENKELQCKGCTNKCSILRFRFPNGNISYAGNKCEKIFHSSGKATTPGFNAFEKKNELLFGSGQSSLISNEENKKLRIGIPRVLNMYENYPFWEALFEGCGIETVLSPESNYTLYQKGVGNIMSDNICFPAKLVHGHILSLIELKVDRICYPIIPKERKEFKNSNNSYNCPVVSGYPDVIRSSMDPEQKYNTPLDTPVIGFNDNETLKKSCRQYLETLGVSKGVFTKAFEHALKVRDKKRQELIDFQKDKLKEAIDNNRLVFIVAGRPYHSDPLIHQKTGQILADLGGIVLTDDVFRNDRVSDFERLNLVSQWSYPNRVMQSALRVAELPQNVQLIQLNSFGCGPDSFLMDEATDVLKKADKNLTIVRIDEIASPGSVRLRLRSLVESLANKHMTTKYDEKYKGYQVTYTKKDRQKTILIPWLCDFLNPFVPALGELAGYNLVNLPKSNRASVDTGLKYGHNEVCYPSVLVLGDIINALQSGNYDLDNIAVAITQTGGQCRATNYIAQIKTGMERAGFTNIPIVALTSGKTYQNEQSGFKIPWLKMANIAIYLILYGDGLQQMYAAISPREKKKGDTKALFDFYMEQGSEAIRRNDHKMLVNLLRQAVADFNNIPIHDRQFTKIGLIGEIFVKYNNYAQAFISDWLREKGLEVVTPPILDFVIQFFVNSSVNYEHGIKRGGKFLEMIKPALWKYMNVRINQVNEVLKDFKFYQAAESIYTKAEYASEILSLTNQFGEGWSVAAEVACFAREGINKVVCIQPFGCIANHVVAKGVENRLKKFYPEMSLLYLDIDGGVGEVNLQNRLHFMI